MNSLQIEADMHFTFICIVVQMIGKKWVEIFQQLQRSQIISVMLRFGD